MTIYHEGSRILESYSSQPSSSLKSLIYAEYGAKNLKQKQEGGKSRTNTNCNDRDKGPIAPAMLYALVINALKHQEILNEVIRNSGILRVEKKLSHSLTLLLLQDYLISKGKISVGKSHPLREAIDRNKARLSAEFIKAKIRRGFASTDAYLAASIQEDDSEPQPEDHKKIARWVRVNRIKATMGQVLSQHPFSTYTQVENFAKLWDSSNSDHEVYYVDEHIPNLLAFHPSKTSEITSHTLYRNGMLIIQDKASCIPAHVLSPPPDAYVIDACAAPGNKTTHLAAIMAIGKGGDSQDSLACGEKDKNLFKGKIIAFERDHARAEVLEKMITKARAGTVVSVMKGIDFLTTGNSFWKEDKGTEKHKSMDVGGVWELITHLLLDPSCSGSGIAGRYISEPVYIPLPDDKGNDKNSGINRKRKRNRMTNNATDGSKKTELPIRTVSGPPPAVLRENEMNQQNLEISATGQQFLKSRLESLSAFQYRIISHAFNPNVFPCARRITYSTCSVYPEENEHVVVSALLSDTALDNGWEIEANPYGMDTWKRRGDRREIKRKMMEIAGETNGKKWMSEHWVGDVSNGCIRTSHDDGTGGFFVACFVRKENKEASRGKIKDVDKCAGDDTYTDDGEEWKGFDD